jgi:hypothetical protein
LNDSAGSSPTWQATRASWRIGVMNNDELVEDQARDFLFTLRRGR